MPPAICPNCRANDWRFLGSGTKRIEVEVKKLFPGARTLRLDQDSLDLKTIETVYADLVKGRVDILIGTQMVAKGFDFPKLQTVGIVAADSTLNLPDYIASERTFQLITQAAGRAGRRNQAANIIIQSYNPDHPAIKLGALGNFDEFTQIELEHRKLLQYPPYIYLAKLICAQTKAARAQIIASALARTLSQDKNLLSTWSGSSFSSLC